MSGRGPDRMPRVGVDVRTSLPGAVLRVAAALLPAATWLLAFGRSSLPGELSPAAVVIAVGLTASILWRPGCRQALAVAVACVLLVALGRGAGLDAWTIGIAVLAYAGVRLGTWAGTVGWAARVELVALGASALRDGAVLAVTVLIGVLGLAVEGASAIALVAGAVAVLALAWWVLRPEDESTS